MPVIAIAAAATSFSIALPIFTAAGAMTATAVMAGAVMAGSAMTILGTVTGNKNLTNIGAIVGGVGGIGLMGIATIGGGLDKSMAIPQVGATEAAAATGSAVSAPAAEVANAVAPPVPTDTLADALKATPPGAPAIDAAAALTQPSTSTLPSLNQTLSQSSLLPTPNGMIGQASLAPGAGDSIKALISAPNMSMWDKFLEFNKTNPETAKMGFDAFQSFATALVPKPVTEQEEAQTEYMRQRTLDDQRKALSAGGYASGSRGLVNSSYYGRSTQ